MATKKDNGGPAFPLSRAHFVEDGKKLSSADWVTGMSLRDYFAAKAMQAMIGSDPDAGNLIDSEEAKRCRCAYSWADAMLAARKE